MIPQYHDQHETECAKGNEDHVQIVSSTHSRGQSLNVHLVRPLVPQPSDLVPFVIALAADELIPDPAIVTTQAVWIEAPPVAIWPWLVQLGQDRAGMYSYEAAIYRFARATPGTTRRRRRNLLRARRTSYVVHDTEYAAGNQGARRGGANAEHSYLHSRAI